MRVYGVVLVLVALLGVSAGAFAQGCTVQDITIKSIRAGFVDRCSGSPCYYMKGIAVLTNGCRQAIGVQVKITGYDRSGAPVATRELWPASVSNIPPGDYEFSLDQWLEYDPAIKKFSARAVDVRRW